ncbi:prolyl oligopeptidase family serine peptidase [Nocardiopsis sp. CNT-189]|uniref:prolyl oligopeptidase family serine peptidase n=1 Tax=Nocardiopsis oceanisediminis TaxID=2816862 RepID=UPI003B3B922F
MPAPPLTASVLAGGDVPLDPVLSPDGRWVRCAVAAAGRASERPASALWAAAAPRRLTGGTGPERGVADPVRLGIGGWSHGGTMAAWAVGRTDRFRAAVVGAGVRAWFDRWLAR